MVSLIIPVYNEEDAVPALLETLHNLHGSFEVIFADGGGSTLPLLKAGYPKGIFVQSLKGRALQMNAAASHAQGDILWFVHADSALHLESVTAIEDAVRKGIQAGCFSLFFKDSPGLGLQWIAFFSRLRARLFKIFYGDQGIFIRKDLFYKLGGFPKIPLMEDYALSLALKGVRRQALALEIGTSARRFLQGGIWHTLYLMHRLQRSYRRGADPARLALLYDAPKRRALIVFTRSPEPGHTKTRMMPFLSPEECAALHSSLLKDLSRNLCPGFYDLLIAYEGSRETLNPIFPQARGFIPQSKGTLGKRMHAAFAAAFARGHTSLVLIGTDTPEIRGHDIHRAFQVLDRRDLVLGAAKDGGYFLIGMNRLHDALFGPSITWSGLSVFKDTLAVAGKLSRGLVRPLSDIDTPADLAGLKKRIPLNTHMGRFLSSLGGRL